MEITKEDPLLLNKDIPCILLLSRLIVNKHFVEDPCGIGERVRNISTHFLHRPGWAGS